MSQKATERTGKYIVFAFVSVIVLNLSIVKGVIWEDSITHYYHPKDSGFTQELNNIRCVDYQGHLSGKYEPN